MTGKEFIENFQSKNGRLPTAIELQKSLSISSNNAIKLLIEYSKSKKKTEANLQIKEGETKKDFLLLGIKSGLFLTSFLCIVLSIGFTVHWFSDKVGVLPAWFLSVAIVLYTVLSPQTLKLVEGKRFLIISTFLVALIISMVSTVAGQYNKNTENFSSNFSSFNLVKQEKEKETERTEIKNRLAFHQETLEKLSRNGRKENSDYILTERRMVLKYTSDLKNIDSELKLIRENLSKEDFIEREDFYSWVGRLLKVQKFKVEFWLNTLPAIFIDIIAPICLNLALTIDRKKDIV